MSATIVKRITSIGLALVLAVSIAMVPLAVADIGPPGNELGAAGDESGTPVSTQTAEEPAQERDDDPGDDLAPGEHLGSVVGVQQAELDGEVSERAYGMKIESAQSDSDRASVANEQLTHIENRLDELETVREELDAAYENDEISDGEYRAKLAITVAEQRTIERLANNTAATVEQLDDDLLTEHGIDADEARASVDRANTLDGVDVSKLVHSIVGDRVGHPIVSDPVEPLTGERPTTDTDVRNVTVVDDEGEATVELDDLTDIDADDLTDVENVTADDLD